MIIACLVNGSKEGLFPGSLFSCFFVAWTLGISAKKVAREEAGWVGDWDILAIFITQRLLSLPRDCHPVRHIFTLSTLYRREYGAQHTEYF